MLLDLRNSSQVVSVSSASAGTLEVDLQASMPMLVKSIHLPRKIGSFKILGMMKCPASEAERHGGPTTGSPEHHALFKSASHIYVISSDRRSARLRSLE